MARMIAHNRFFDELKLVYRTVIGDSVTGGHHHHTDRNAMANAHDDEVVLTPSKKNLWVMMLALQQQSIMHEAALRGLSAI